MCKSQPKCIKQNSGELTLLPLLLVLSGRFCIDPAASTDDVTFSFYIYWMESTCSLLPSQPFHEDNGQKAGVRWEWRGCPICWVRQEINLHQRIPAVVQNAESRAWGEMEGNIWVLLCSLCKSLASLGVWRCHFGPAATEWSWLWLLSWNEFLWSVTKAQHRGLPRGTSAVSC